MPSPSKTPTFNILRPIMFYILCSKIITAPIYYQLRVRYTYIPSLVGVLLISSFILTTKTSFNLSSRFLGQPLRVTKMTLVRFKRASNPFLLPILTYQKQNVFRLPHVNFPSVVTIQPFLCHQSVDVPVLKLIISWAFEVV